ncbi:hypothetical protein Tco_0703553 [Tanacetum coccineum]|uniref:Retrovirus-related Pol polyprotein from transposon TNT 1-94-like beta-barrel domain-containing protein n=1 Tax=Tanacetum coccineum TaxID=301880 RepID=A0ABQ4Y006_9ASTR
MHNNIMAAGSRDRPPMLATGRYAQWRSRFLRYIDTRPNGDALRKCILTGPYTPTMVTIPAVPATEDSPEIPAQTSVETIMNMTPENKAHFQSEKEAIHLILTGIGDEIYSTVEQSDTQEMCGSIERLQQNNQTASRHGCRKLMNKSWKHITVYMSKRQRFLMQTHARDTEHWKQLDVDENKKIQKQLKKANATLTQELTECKSILAETSRTLGESNSIRDSCLVALQNKQTEFERYKAFNDRTVDYDKLERKLNETLGLLAQKDIDIQEGLKVKAYEISVVQAKHDELVKQSLLTRSHYEGLVKEKTKISRITKLKSSIEGWNVTVLATKSFLNKTDFVRVAHHTDVSRPQPRSNQMQDKVVPYTSHAKLKKTEIVQLILFIVDSGCTKHMTGNVSLLCNFVEKYLGTVRFGNDQFAPILGYGDLVQGNITIKRVYYVEGLKSQSILQVRSLLDAELELHFRKSTCLVEIIQRKQTYYKVIEDLISIQYPFKKQPHQLQFCLLAKASTLSKFMHRRLLISTSTTSTCSKKDIVIG